MDRDPRRPFVSVIIPTYNRERELRDTIAGLSTQSYPDYEVIIVDQSEQHEPETVALLEKLPAPFRYFHLSQPCVQDAINFGVAQASGEIVLLLDDDIRFDNDLVSRHAKAYSDPGIGAVAGRVLDGLAPVKDSALVGRVKMTGEVISDFTNSVETDAATAMGCNMSIRRELFLEIGGVQPAYIGTAVYWETELSCRVRRLGYRIRFVPQAWIFHLRASTGGCSNREPGIRRDYSLYHNTFLFVLRNLSIWNLPLAFMVRLRQALISACRWRKLYLPFIVGVAAVHAFGSWLASSARSSTLHRPFPAASGHSTSDS